MKAPTARLREALARHQFVLLAFIGVLVALLVVVIPARAQAVRTGDLNVAVRVTGVPTALSRDYLLDYTCTDGQQGTVRARGSGLPAPVEGVFPVGTRCTVMADAEALDLPGYTLVPQEGAAPAGSSVVIAGRGEAGPTAVVKIDYRAACGQAAREMGAAGCLSE